MKLSKLSVADLRRIRELLGGKDFGGWYARIRASAKEGARIEVQRKRKAAEDLRALSKVLRQLDQVLERLSVDAFDDALRSSPRLIYAFEAGVIKGESVAFKALAKATEKREIEIANFFDEARQLQSATVSACRELSQRRGGRPSQRAEQMRAISMLAAMYSQATGRTPSAAVNGPFAELVSIVLGVEKVSDMIRDAQPRKARSPRNR